MEKINKIKRGIFKEWESYYNKKENARICWDKSTEH